MTTCATALATAGFHRYLIRPHGPGATPRLRVSQPASPSLGNGTHTRNVGFSSAIDGEDIGWPGSQRMSMITLRSCGLRDLHKTCTDNARGRPSDGKATGGARPVPCLRNPFITAAAGRSAAAATHQISDLAFDDARDDLRKIQFEPVPHYRSDLLCDHLLEYLGASRRGAPGIV